MIMLPAVVCTKDNRSRQGGSVLSDDLGGDRGGKVFPEKMVFLLGLGE